MLPLEMRMNTRMPAESYPDDVIVITGDDDFDKLEQNPDCVCVVVKGCSTIELGAFENMKQLRQVILCGDIQHILLCQPSFLCNAGTFNKREHRIAPAESKQSYFRKV